MSDTRRSWDELLGNDPSGNSGMFSNSTRHPKISSQALRDLIVTLQYLLNQLSEAGDGTTASNIGTSGVGLFKEISGADIKLKKIKPASEKITINNNTETDTVDIDVDPNNITIPQSNVTGLTGNLNTIDSSITAISTAIAALSDAIDGKVPTSRTINGQPLSDNITLTAASVSADPSGTGASAASSAVSTHAAVTNGVHGITSYGSTITSSANATAARSALELGDAATKNVGTSSGAVSAGDHSHPGLSVQDAETASVRSLGYGATEAASGSEFLALMTFLEGLFGIEITAQPEDEQVSEGATATFTVAADNATSYQWQKRNIYGGSWTEISGATSASYTTPALTAAGDSYYEFRCVVAGLNTVNSDAALLVVTLALFDEDFSDDLVPTAGTTYTTSTGVGQLRYYNVQSGDAVSGGKLTFSANPNLIITDWAASRTRLQGRIHYMKAVTKASGAFGAWQTVNIRGTDAGTNFFAFDCGCPGVLVGQETIGYIRDQRFNLAPAGTSTAYTRGNYQIKNYVTYSSVVEIALVERAGQGTFAFGRLNSGEWRMLFVENYSTMTGRLASQLQNSVAIQEYNRLATFNTRFAPSPLLQHSFAAAISPSDGAGQTESGGSGIVAETSGSLTINSGRLTLSADGIGLCVFDVGTDDWVMHVNMRVYNGSPVSVILRYVDANNYLHAQIDSSADRMRLIEVVSGVSTTLNDIALNPGATDTWNVGDAEELYFTARSRDGSNLIVTVARGVLHDSYIESSTTRFGASTKCGVRINKGTGVNSSQARNLAVWSQTQELPTF